jgi:hypothetical protein
MGTANAENRNSGKDDLGFIARLRWRAGLKIKEGGNEESTMSMVRVPEGAACPYEDVKAAVRAALVPGATATDGGRTWRVAERSEDSNGIRGRIVCERQQPDAGIQFWLLLDDAWFQKRYTWLPLMLVSPKLNVRSDRRLFAGLISGASPIPWQVKPVWSIYLSRP